MTRRRVCTLAAVVVLLASASAAAVYLRSDRDAQPGDGPPRPPTFDESLERIRRDSETPVHLTQRTPVDNPTFVRADIPVEPDEPPEKTARAAVAAYAGLFGVDDPSSELVHFSTTEDGSGAVRVRLSQEHEGVPVHNSFIDVHIDESRSSIQAFVSGFVPGIDGVDVEPDLDASAALQVARLTLPTGRPVGDPVLQVYAGLGDDRLDDRNHLAWFVELRAPGVPARNQYVVDANEGGLLDVIDLLPTDMERETYTADGSTSLPGELVREEGDGPAGDVEVDDAHDHTGATYEYFLDEHGRDSFDDNGATLQSTVRYGNEPQAGWDGSQTMYSEGFATLDVVAHEWTHAVTEHTAGLEYRAQSGALSESFSDIFGSLVDAEDWQLGEDVPGGPLRYMADPEKSGDPDHVRDWDETCADNEGVHSNSGITNHAFFLVASDVGRDKAGRIFYRTLTTYLTPTASLEDARSGAIQSAEDVYGADSEEVEAVERGFRTVGLTGSWSPPSIDCPPPLCAAEVAVAGRRPAAGDGASALETLVQLQEFRGLMQTTAGGSRLASLFETHSSELGMMLLKDAQLRTGAASVVDSLAPGISSLNAGSPEDVLVSEETIRAVRGFIRDLIARDLSEGLDRTILRETSWYDFDDFIGMTYEELWEWVSEGRIPDRGPGSITCHGFEIAWRDPPVDPAAVTVTNESGTVVYEQTEEGFSVGGQTLYNGFMTPTYCGDILGDGTPVLIVSTYSGGAHCCTDDVVVTLGTKAENILSARLGNALGLTPTQLDEGPMELVSASDVFAYFGNLPYVISPFLPLVYEFDGRAFVEATREHSSFVREHLESSWEDLRAAQRAEYHWTAEAGAALGVFGDYVLLGTESRGLSILQQEVSPRVASWLGRYAPEAEALIMERFN